MRPQQHLINKYSSSSSSAAAPVRWISPLQYLKHPSSPPKPSPPPPRHPPAKPKPRPRFISHADAVRFINRQADPQRALDLFNAAAAQRGFNHNNATYSAILLRLARSPRRCLPALDALIRRMSLEPCRFEEGVFLRLMPILARAGFPEKSLQVFRAILPLVRRSPSCRALATCLDAFVEAQRFDLAERLLSVAKSEFRVELNACVYNILVKFHCRSGRMTSAFEILEEMRRSETEKPNLITYSTLMGGLCREGRLKDAFELFEEMIEKDKIVPDHLTYNVLIEGFCRNGQVDKARTVFAFMRDNGCEPNMFNYATLMNGYCKQGQVEEAREVLEEMGRMGLEIDAVTYTTLIGCLCREGKVDEGIELVKEMRQMGCKADVVTYNVVIEGLCKEGRTSDAMDMLEGLPYEGVKLNVASYRIVINCLCGRGEMEKAVGLLGLMIGRGFVPHFATSNKLLVGLCEVGRMADSTVALYGLAEMGFSPAEDTWIRLAESVCRERKLIQAFQLFDSIVTSEENNEVRSSLCNEDRDDDAVSRFEGPSWSMVSPAEDTDDGQPEARDNLLSKLNLQKINKQTTRSFLRAQTSAKRI